MQLGACLPKVAATNPYDPEVPAEQQQEASLTGEVFGDLLDGTDPLLLAGATVTLTGPTMPINSPLVTDPDGVFRFVSLTPGTYSLEVSHPGHHGVGRDLILAAGEDRQLPITLAALQQVGGEQSGHIRGIVTLESPTNKIYIYESAFIAYTGEREDGTVPVFVTRMD